MAAPPSSGQDQDQDPASPRRWVRACGRDALDANAILPLVVAGRHLILMRDGDAVRASERACPHEGADLALGRCAAGKLFCPRHLAWFDLAAGTVSPGWAFRPLRVYPARIVGAEVFVALDR